VGLSQRQIAAVWGPGCYHGVKAAVRLFGGGVVTVRPAVVPAVEALDAVLRRWNYATRAAVTGAYVCRQKVGGGGVSNHSFGTALDINWDRNPYGRRLVTDMPAGMRAEVKAIRTNNGRQVWGWGGDWSGNKDAMHWEMICLPGDLATGIAGRTAAVAPPTRAPSASAAPTVAPAVPTPPVVASPRPPLLFAPEEDDEMRIIQHAPTGAARLLNGGALFDLIAESYNYYRNELGVRVDVVDQLRWDIWHACSADGNALNRELKR